MRRAIPTFLFTALTVFAIVGPANPVHAEWILNGVRIDTGIVGQAPVATPDGEGGAIIAFTFWNGINADIHAQRIDGNGNPLWGPNGVVVCAAANDQYVDDIAPDGSGGAVIVWTDFRSGSDDDVYAQQLDSSGNPLWASDGVPVIALSSLQRSAVVLPNFIVAWEDFRNGNSDIYVQKLDAAGSPIWTATGVPVCTATGDQDRVVATTDGSAGAVIAWNDRRGSDIDIYAQHVNFFGTPDWTTNGVALSGAPLFEVNPSIIADGTGGAFITFWNGVTTAANVYVERVRNDGTAVWGSGGRLICDAPEAQTWPLIASDGSGGAIITWQDDRSTVGDVYAQRVDSQLNVLWSYNGVPVCTQAAAQTNPKISSDGEGGAVITWFDERADSDGDLFTQRIDGNGQTYWAPDGVPVVQEALAQYSPALVGDNSGGMIMAWVDERTGPSTAVVYAQRVEPRHGYWGRPEPSITSAADNPADQGGSVALDWSASQRDVLVHQEISHYSIWRALNAVAATTSQDIIDTSPGAAAALQKMLVDPSEVGADFEGPAFRAAPNATDYYWEFVSTQDAIYAAGYSDLVPTRQDSTLADPAVHYFQVLAHTFNPQVFFPSGADSGYSVDNLAPASPLMLSAVRAGGDIVDLDWVSSGLNEPDFKEYWVYRGETSGFPLDTAHFFTATADTVATDNAADAGTAYYYVTVSVDVHDNQSDPSNEAMVGAVVVGIGDHPPAITAFTVLPNSPNPFGNETEIRVGLPEPSDVTLEVYDVAGRKVFTREFDRMAEGWRRLTFDGRDDSGKPLASGVYFLRVNAIGETVTRKMVIAR